MSEKYESSPSPSEVGFSLVSRRTLLAGAAAVGGAAVLAACGDDEAAGGGADTTAAGGTDTTAAAAPTPRRAATFGSVTFGSTSPTRRTATAIKAAVEPPASTSRSTRSTTTRTRRTSTPTSSSPTTWCAGSPAIACAAFAGKGVVGDISDVWATSTGMSEGFKNASTGARRQAVLRAVLLLPVGHPLPEEPVRGEGLRDPAERGTTCSRCARR